MRPGSRLSQVVGRPLSHIAHVSETGQPRRSLAYGTVRERNMRNLLCPMLLAVLLLPLTRAAAGAEEKPASVSLNSPNCVKAPEARGEQPEDEELGVGRNGEYCAYPVRMMAYHR